MKLLLAFACIALGGARAAELLASFEAGVPVAGQVLAAKGRSFNFAFGTSDGAAPSDKVGFFGFAGDADYIPMHSQSSVNPSNARAFASGASLTAVDTLVPVTVIFGGSNNLTTQHVSAEAALLTDSGMVMHASRFGFNPLPVANHSMLTYEPMHIPPARILVYGGQDGAGNVLAQAFHIINATIEPASVFFEDFPLTNARPRAGHCMVSAGSSQVLVLFGKDDQGNFHFKNYLEIDTTAGFVNENSFFGFDSAPNRSHPLCGEIKGSTSPQLIVYGGLTESGLTLNDVWVIEGATVNGPLAVSSRLPGAYRPFLAGGRAMARAAWPNMRVWLHGGRFGGMGGYSSKAFLLDIPYTTSPPCPLSTQYGNTGGWLQQIDECTRAGTGLSVPFTWSTPAAGERLCNCTQSVSEDLVAYSNSYPECDQAHDDIARVNAWLSNSCASPEPIVQDCAELYVKTHQVWSLCAYNGTFENRCECATRVMPQIGLDFNHFAHCPLANHIRSAAFPCSAYRPPLCYLNGMEAVDVCKQVRGRVFGWTCDHVQISSAQCPEYSVYDGVQCLRLCNEDERVELEGGSGQP